MADDLRLSRLESVELRNAWQTEAGDFTPWLAQETNISLLGDTIGLDLEVEAQEKQVGPFRADILCKDTAAGSWVLVENQLEKTDHTHLGQLITYAAGLSAVTIVWIAARVRDEHRASIDWLNEITDDRFNFFALEVELWRIGKSPYAPKFNVVCKPNDWTRSVTGATRSLEQDNLTETKQLQLEYWTAFRALMEERGGNVRPTKPHPQHWYSLSIGRTNFWLNASANIQHQRIHVDLIIAGNDAKPLFHLLHAEKAEIDSVFDSPLDWREMPDKQQSRIVLSWHDCDPSRKSDWPTQHNWLHKNLELFHSSFSQRVKQLDASDYYASDDAE